MHPRRATALRLAQVGCRGPKGLAAAAAVLTVLFLAGCATASDVPPSTARSQQEPTWPAPSPTVEAPDAQVADPVRVRIPGIGVNAGVDPLDTDEKGVLPPPRTNERTGWWRSGPEPGERGPAVIVGHVDSYRGPAVFFRLRELKPGDEIIVDRADGTAAVFAVRRVERHSKDAFPTHAVYGKTAQPELRLITCGGEFDDVGRRYLDNVIVYAALAREP